MTTADLAGNWTFIDFQTPVDLVETYFHSINETTRQGDSSDFARENERLVDVYLKGCFESEIGSFAISSGGLVTGDVNGSGTAATDGQVSVNLGEGIETFQANASMDFMVRAL